MASAAATPATTPVTHYENFPVASWLCPPRLRAPIAAIYHFARTADDIADEGQAPAGVRLEQLAAYRADLAALAAGQPTSARWPQVFEPLARALDAHRLPLACLADLLSAFEQDVLKTRESAWYADRAELLDYCRRSAEPIGRLLLHLHRVDDPMALARSDAVCSALQLVNFWQDLSIDLPRGRFYLPLADCAAHGVTRDQLLALRPTAATARLVAAEVRWARGMMLEGASIVRSVPGRAGWELRVVVQGGLRILDRIEAIGYATLAQRPTLSRRDAPLLLWRALRM